MPVQVFVAEVRSGRIVPDWSLPLPEGLRVTVVADVPVADRSEKGLVAVDPEDAELIQALNEAQWPGVSAALRPSVAALPHIGGRWSDA